MEYLKFFIESLINFYISQPSILALTIVTLIFCILIYKYYPKVRGYMGEFWVKKELDKLPKDEYIVLNDLLLVTDNKSTQIDHLVISRFGIFVIEMKNFYGYIYGEEYNKKWCQYLGKKKSHFYNPIRQNYGHMKVLETVSNLPFETFISIICFSNQATLKVKTKTTVLQLDNLSSYILDFKDEILNKNLEDIKKIFLEVQTKNKYLRKEHIQKIQRESAKKEELEKRMICPKCGNSLIEREGKYGKFIGCSNYPSCRYTKNV